MDNLISTTAITASIGHNGAPVMITNADIEVINDFVDESFAGSRKLRDFVKKLNLDYTNEAECDAVLTAVKRRYIYRSYYEHTNSAQKASALTDQAWTASPKARKAIKERYLAKKEAWVKAGNRDRDFVPEVGDMAWHVFQAANVFAARVEVECGLKAPPAKREKKEKNEGDNVSSENVLPPNSIPLTSENIIIERVTDAQGYAEFMLHLAMIAQRFASKNADVKTEGLATDLAQVVADIHASCKGYKIPT